MKKFILFAIIFFAIAGQGFAQSYLGWVKKSVKLREGPGTEYSVLMTLKAGSQIFLYSLETENDFYYVIDIESNTEGYIPSTIVKLGDVVERSSTGLFSPSGRSAEYNPELKVFNDTRYNMTLRLNESVYEFSPQETRYLSVSPGTYEFFASAPGVIPTFGSDILQSNTIYDWHFYVITSRR
jgi:uncharacterized protein YgiM (DUF1202 family)